MHFFFKYSSFSLSFDRGWRLNLIKFNFHVPRALSTSSRLKILENGTEKKKLYGILAMVSPRIEQFKTIHLA